MLENDYSTQISNLLEELPCPVSIPAEWGDYFSREGMPPPIENDLRRLPRKHFRSKAVLEIKGSLPAIARQPSVQVVYTRDISREAISFLHSEQLYPGEVCRLWLTDRRLEVHVVRCVRVQASCYVVAGSFDAAKA